jgi:hypothetical protein
MVPERADDPEFGVTEYVTNVEPLPLEAELSVIQDAFD